jgi:hypothetical protein
MLRRLSVDEHCDDLQTCQSVWDDDDGLDDLVIVGHPVPPGTVPLSEGEVAVRIRRRIVADAKIV